MPLPGSGQGPAVLRLRPMTGPASPCGDGPKSRLVPGRSVFLTGLPTARNRRRTVRQFPGKKTPGRNRSQIRMSGNVGRARKKTPERAPNNLGNQQRLYIRNTTQPWRRKNRSRAWRERRPGAAEFNRGARRGLGERPGQGGGKEDP